MNVQIPPTITHFSEKLDGKEFLYYKMICVASGKPEPTYEFYKGIGLVQSNNWITVDAEKGILTINKLYYKLTILFIHLSVGLDKV